MLFSPIINLLMFLFFLLLGIPFIFNYLYILNLFKIHYFNLITIIIFQLQKNYRCLFQLNLNKLSNPYSYNFIQSFHPFKYFFIYQKFNILQFLVKIAYYLVNFSSKFIMVQYLLNYQVNRLTIFLLDIHILFNYQQ